jgi:hypothetical protein
MTYLMRLDWHSSFIIMRKIVAVNIIKYTVKSNIYSVSKSWGFSCPVMHWTIQAGYS